MIYTKTGDQGETSLANGQRVSKTDVRLEAYGTVDELNSYVGWLRACCDEQADGQLRRIQNKLFNIGASLSCAPGEWISPDDVHELEEWIDGIQAQLPPMHAFVLPSGNEAAGRCHICRTVCRRAERRMIEADSCGEQERKYINRLSDYLFVLARYLVHLKGENEEKWQK